MEQISGFIMKFRLLSFMNFITSLIMAGIVADKVFAGRGPANEAMGGRRGREPLYTRCISYVKHSVKEVEKRDKTGFYEKIKIKMKRSGYKGEYAPAVYFLVQFVVPVLLFAFSLAGSYPSIKRPFLIGAFSFFITDMVVRMEKKKHNMIFQKHIYKIYKYLHNQISSGVKVTDAVKTVYEVVDNNMLKEILIKLAARFELTLDIDASLDEFRENFDLHEVETLCVALKQGVITGDNRELLARQEEIMFKKYFSYIQAETDSLKVRSTVAVSMFCAAIVIMIVIPLFNDVIAAMGQIFMF